MCRYGCLRPATYRYRTGGEWWYFCCECDLGSPLGSDCQCQHSNGCCPSDYEGDHVSFGCGNTVRPSEAHEASDTGKGGTIVDAEKQLRSFLQRESLDHILHMLRPAYTGVVVALLAPSVPLTAPRTCTDGNGVRRAHAYEMVKSLDATCDGEADGTPGCLLLERRPPRLSVKRLSAPTCTVNNVNKGPSQWLSSTTLPRPMSAPAPTTSRDTTRNTAARWAQWRDKLRQHVIKRWQPQQTNALRALTKANISKYIEEHRPPQLSYAHEHTAKEGTAPGSRQHDPCTTSPREEKRCANTGQRAYTLVGALDLDIVSQSTYEQRSRDAARLDGWGRTAAEAAIRHGMFILNWCVSDDRNICWAEAAAATLEYRHRASHKAARELREICSGAGTTCLGIVAVIYRAVGLILQPFYLIGGTLHEETAEWTRGTGGMGTIHELASAGDWSAAAIHEQREGLLFAVYGAVRLWACRHRVKITGSQHAVGWMRTAAHTSPDDDPLIPCRVLVLCSTAVPAGEVAPHGTMPVAPDVQFSMAAHHVVALGDALVSTPHDQEGSEAVRQLMAGTRTKDWIYEQIRRAIESPYREGVVTGALKLSQVLSERSARADFLTELVTDMGTRLLEGDAFLAAPPTGQLNPDNVLYRAVHSGNTSVSLLTRAILAKHSVRITQTLLDLLQRKRWREMTTAHARVIYLRASANGVRDFGTFGESYARHWESARRRLRDAAANVNNATSLRSRLAAQHVLRTTQTETRIEVPDLSGQSVRGRYTTIVVQDINLISASPWAALCDTRRLRVGTTKNDGRQSGGAQSTHGDAEPSITNVDQRPSAPRTSAGPREAHTDKNELRARCPEEVGLGVTPSSPQNSSADKLACKSRGTAHDMPALAQAPARHHSQPPRKGQAGRADEAYGAHGIGAAEQGTPPMFAERQSSTRADRIAHDMSMCGDADSPAYRKQGSAHAAPRQESGSARHARERPPTPPMFEGGDEMNDHRSQGTGEEANALDERWRLETESRRLGATLVEDETIPDMFASSGWDNTDAHSPQANTAACARRRAAQELADQLTNDTSRYALCPRNKDRLQDMVISAATARAAAIPHGTKSSDAWGFGWAVAAGQSNRRRIIDMSNYRYEHSLDATEGATRVEGRRTARSPLLRPPAHIHGQEHAPVGANAGTRLRPGQT